MATDNEVGRATHILRKAASQLGRRHSRQHCDGIERDELRERALEGLCGQCDALQVEIHSERGPNHEGLSLRCTKGISPIDLYRRTPLGTDADCSGFQQR